MMIVSRSPKRVVVRISRGMKLVVEMDLFPCVGFTSLVSPNSSLENHIEFCVAWAENVNTAITKGSEAKKGEKAAIRPLLRSASDATCWTDKSQVPEHWTERAEHGTQVSS